MTASDDLRVLALWSRRHSHPPALELRCAEAGTDAVSGNDLVVRLSSCLADASLADLAGLVAATSGLRLRFDSCAGEPGAPVAEVAALVAALDLPAERLLRHRAGDDAPGQEGPELDVRRLPPRRRGLVGWFLPHQPEVDDVEEVLAPSLRTVAAVRELAGPGELPSVAAALPSPALNLTSAGCTACGTCVRVCPVDVLHLTPADDDDRRRLEFRAAGCIGCRECIDICPADALRGEEHLNWGTLLRSVDDGAGATVLEQVTTMTCDRCRVDFAGDGVLCPVCRERRSNPFGSTMPPHLLDLLHRPEQ